LSSYRCVVFQPSAEVSVLSLLHALALVQAGICRGENRIPTYELEAEKYCNSSGKRAVSNTVSFGTHLWEADQKRDSKYAKCKIVMFKFEVRE